MTALRIAAILFALIGYLSFAVMLGCILKGKPSPMGARAFWLMNLSFAAAAILWFT